MSLLQKSLAAVLALLLIAVGYGLWATNDSSTAPVQQKSATVVVAGTNAMPVIDQHTLLVAQRLARIADTPEEQTLAQQAVQTADHELDLAFAAALQHLEMHPPPLSPEAQKIQEHLLDQEKQLAADTESVKQLSAQLEKAPAAEKPAIQDHLDLAQAQLNLEQDEVQEGNDALLQAGGNVHQRIQSMQKEHEAAEHAPALPPPAATNTLRTLKGMVGQMGQWLDLRRKQRWLTWAREHVSASADELTLERAKMAAQLEASKALIPEFSAHGTHATAAPPQTHAAPPAGAPSPTAAPGAPAQAPAAGTATAPATLLDLTRQIAAEQRRLTLRDERIVARQHLAQIYGKWYEVIASQARTVLHAWLSGAIIVLGALLILLFLDGWLEHLMARTHIDRRQLQTLRSVLGVSLQLVGVVLILLMLIGVPAQIGTLLGIIGAGLTVALKDFIIAFIGWFVLMGRNGMRLADWVEINGVSGEVIELNMFHTVLLETGNWTDAGHPTGRRVTFTNSFAISGHYFNFSTSGQWLWDELSVMVPYDRDPHAIADALQKEVTAATANDARDAEAEWRRVAKGQRGTFTAQPGIAIRPSSGGSGVEIAVRYVTRASERLALRGRLYQIAVQLLAAHPPPQALAAGAGSPGAAVPGTR
jgi:small-conductance mechanosensitive channel